MKNIKDAKEQEQLDCCCELHTLLDVSFIFLYDTVIQRIQFHLTHYIKIYREKTKKNFLNLNAVKMQKKLSFHQKIFLNSLQRTQNHKYATYVFFRL